MPLLISVVPSTGSTAKSHSGPSPLPTSSPLNSIGASSFSPSPMTTTPRIDTELTSSRIASTAAPSPPSLSPRPTQRPAAMAPASVTRTNSRARLRSGASRRVRAARRGRQRRSATNRIPTSARPQLSWLPIVPETDRSAGAGLWLLIAGWDTRGVTDEQQPNADAGRRAGARGEACQTAAPAGRSRHVLVAGAAADRLHRAGRPGGHVLVSAWRNQQRDNSVLRRGARRCGRMRRRWASRSGCRRCPGAGRPTPATAALSTTGEP